MAVFRCKMCGGDLEIQEGMTVCECEYCGSIQTVPQLDDEKKINLFSRANRLRSACEFDKASGVYESIVSEFPEEAEAYWGLVLCQYGIEYVDDPKTGRKIPTCHRSSFESIMDDTNYEMVLEYSDVASRAVYRSEAKAIEKLRTAIIEVSSKEDPYDIFICYKETDSMGERTIDSVIAQDVYDALTEKGYKVFFSRITLEDKLGQEYEPYIFAALNSAKIMLAFGTDYEYYNAVWVKNEWSRFLSLIEKGSKKTLIPCFKGIDAYDLPKEFARLQAQDMGKVGAIQDLLRGIGKILGADIKPMGNSVIGAGSADGSALVQRGNMALEDRDFVGAETFFERALDINPADARAYLGKFLANSHVPSLAGFEDRVCWLKNAKEFKRAEQFADPTLAKKLKVFREANNQKIERLRFMDAIKKITEKKAIIESMQLTAQCTEKSYNKALALFDAIAESKCISFGKARSYKKAVESQYAVLKYLKENFNVCSYTNIQIAAREFMGYGWRTDSLDQLVTAGFIEKHVDGYCWPGVKEEKERLSREAKERKERERRQLAAYDEGCRRVEAQISAEIAAKSASVSESFDYQLREIQREIDRAIAENDLKRQRLEQQISVWNSQKDKLGFFKRKEKNALQAQINDAQSRLDTFVSAQQIEASFKPRLDQVNNAKNAVIDSIRAEVVSKYPLPEYEDFAE